MGAEVYKVMRDNELIERAAVEWVSNELGQWLKAKPPKASDRFGIAFSDGAYWAIAQIEAGRIKVKGGGA